jgi:hypothetical protein
MLGTAKAAAFSTNPSIHGLRFENLGRAGEAQRIPPIEQVPHLAVAGRPFPVLATPSTSWDAFADVPPVKKRRKTRPRDRLRNGEIRMIFVGICRYRKAAAPI